MKRCPSCQRRYGDDSLSYCLEDGSLLLADGSEAPDLAATLIIAEPRVTVPVKQETFRPSQPPTPHGYPAPQAAWPHSSPPLNPRAAPGQQGRGAGVTSLVCGVGAFLLLGFCIIAGAADVDASLIGGIFIFSVVLALAGAVLGIVAVAKSSKDAGAQNIKTLSVVALVLNGIYLLLSTVFLILGAAAG